MKVWQRKYTFFAEGYTKARTAFVSTAKKNFIAIYGPVSQPI